MLIYLAEIPINALKFLLLIYMPKIYYRKLTNLSKKLINASSRSSDIVKLLLLTRLTCRSIKKRTLSSS